jgi:hypothetical protein
MEFPRIVAAWKRRDQSQWEIGDEIITVAGRPDTPGVHNDTLVRIKAEIETNGFDCPIGALRDYRGIAAAFAAGDRSPAASWTAHYIAGNPDTLVRITAAAGNRPLTAALTRQLKKQIAEADAAAIAAAAPATIPATTTGAATTTPAPTTSSTATTSGGSSTTEPTTTETMEAPDFLAQFISDVDALTEHVAANWSDADEIAAYREGIAATRASLDRFEAVLNHGPRTAAAAD